MKNEIEVIGIEKAGVIIPKEVTQLRDSLLATARTAICVSDESEQAKAFEILKKLEAMSRGMESTRKEVKKPVLALGKKIDSMAEEFIVKVESEVMRISRLIAHFQEAERARAEQIRQAEEQNRIRIENEAKKKAHDLEQELLRTRGSIQVAAVMDKMEEVETEAKEHMKDSFIATMEAAPAREDGMIFKENWLFEITDIDQVFRHNPMLCKIEPDNATIRAQLKKGMRVCPGMRIYKENKIGVRMP